MSTGHAHGLLDCWFLCALSCSVLLCRVKSRRAPKHPTNPPHLATVAAATSPDGIFLGVWEPVANLFKMGLARVTGARPSVHAFLITSILLHGLNGQMVFVWVVGR